MGDVVCGIVYFLVIMFLIWFYMDIYGFFVVVVGVMFLVMWVLDVIIDLLIGIVVDCVKICWGYFCLWFIWFVVFYVVLVVMIFMILEFGVLGKLVYVYLIYILFMLCYIFINIFYCVLGGVIMCDEKDCFLVQLYCFMILFLVGLMVFVVILFLVDFFGKENKQFGFQVIMGIMGVIVIVMLVFCFFFIKECVVLVVEQQGSICEDFCQLLVNDQWCIVVIIIFFFSMVGVMCSVVMFYYVIYLMLGGVELVVGMVMKLVFVFISVVGMIIGSIVVGWLVKCYCVVLLFKNINFLLVLVGVVMFFVLLIWLLVVFFLYFLVGFFYQMYQLFKWNMMVNVVDYGEWKFGCCIMGLFYFGNLFVLKMGMVVVGVVVGFLFGLFGYQVGVMVQILLVIMGIVGLLIFGLLLFYLFLWWLVCFYKLDDKMMQIIQCELFMCQQQGYLEMYLLLNVVLEKV